MYPEKGQKTDTPEVQKNRARLTHKKIIILCAVSLVAILLLAATLFYLDKLYKIQYTEAYGGRVDTSLIIEHEVYEGEFETAPELQAPAGDIATSENILNFLLLGTDEEGEAFSDAPRADAVLLLSLNTVDNSIKLISLQRGTGVPIPGRPDDWLCHTSAYGGPGLTVEIVESCFLVEIEGFVRVNLNAFEKIIDAIGGIEVDLTFAEADFINGEVTRNDHPEHAILEKGVNHLDGYNALQYARLRYIDDDWRRVERQRTVMAAALSGVSELNVFQMNALADEIFPMIQTDLSAGRISQLLLIVPQFLGSGMEQMTLPAAGTFTPMMGDDGRVLNVADFEENARILHEFIGIE